MNAIRPASALMTLLASFVLAGCYNPYKPATPERPIDGIVVLEDYTEPDSVLDTIERCFAAKSDGATAYLNALGTGFVATHAVEVVNRYEAAGGVAPPEWNLGYERTNLFPYMSALRSEDYKMRFYRDNTLPADDDNRTSGNVLYHRYYTLTTMREDGSVADTIAIGIADLTLQLDGTRWALSRWVDTFRPDAGIGVNPVNTNLQSMGARRLDSLSR
jgi:hypothetical protein